MSLTIIGIGLGDKKDITLRGLEEARRADRIYLESYTSLFQSSTEELEELYGKKIILADRKAIEETEEILDEAASKHVALLVIGDPFSATTHIEVFLEAKKRGIDVKVINNASVMNAIGIAGLEIYKYGKTTSIVFPDEKWKVEAHYDAILANKSLGLHTLCLLDIKADQKRYMTVNQAIQNLLQIERERNEEAISEESIIIGCARLGSDDFFIKSGKAKDLMGVDFGKPLHCLIIPGKLHFKEEEAIECWK